jgi:hypothetical protein
MDHITAYISKVSKIKGVSKTADHGSHGKHGSSGSHDSDCQCECVEGLAEQLEKRKGERVQVFERNGDIAAGIIKDIKDDSVLILENPPGQDRPFKLICRCNNQLVAVYEEIVISICEITEFGVLSPAGPGLTSLIQP